jgi:hypothetical protein
VKNSLLQGIQARTPLKYRTHIQSGHNGAKCCEKYPGLFYNFLVFDKIFRILFPDGQD